MEKFLPRRPRLQHDTPGWVDDREYFITVCCAQRGWNKLCYPDISALIFESFRFYHNQYSCQTELLVLMPDHFHAILKAPDRLNLASWISDLKHWLSRKGKVVFQENFFDHRLRSASNAAQKWRYVDENPVRAGLIKRPEDWPYRFTSMDFQSVGRAVPRPPR